MSDWGGGGGWWGGGGRGGRRRQLVGLYDFSTTQMLPRD